MFLPEIVAGDPLYVTIVDAVVRTKPATILEIGSANGLGSTQAFIRGIREAGISDSCCLYCIEADKERFGELVQNTQEYDFVLPRNYCSVSTDDYMDEASVRDFLANRGYRTRTVRYGESTVLGWRSDELAYIKLHSISQNGVKQIRKDHGIGDFDMVLVDGSAFTGWADYQSVRGAKTIILDDTIDIKCYDAVRDLLRDRSYISTYNNHDYRNGCAIFVRS